MSRVFGDHLEGFANRMTTKKGIPDLIIKCAEYLVARGLRLEGLFRVPPSSSELDNIRDMFDSGI